MRLYRIVIGLVAGLGLLVVGALNLSEYRRQVRLQGHATRDRLLHHP